MATVVSRRGRTVTKGIAVFNSVVFIVYIVVAAHIIACLAVSAGGGRRGGVVRRGVCSVGVLGLVVRVGGVGGVGGVGVRARGGGGRLGALQRPRPGHV